MGLSDEKINNEGMKRKIGFNQSDMITMLVEKLNFLTIEYQNLHGCFTYDGKGRTKTDPIKMAESYQNFLSEYGDIKRLLKFYDMFNEDVTVIKNNTMDISTNDNTQQTT